MSQFVQTLPEEIQKMIQERYQSNQSSEEQRLIGAGGYVAQDSKILEDALIALSLGKNVLLKGPTGSGKTKLAETLSGNILSADA